MRKYSILLISLISFSTAIIGQTNSPLESFFSSKSVEQIGTHFSSSIELEIPNSKGVYNIKQASVVIDKFLKEHNPVTYSSIHEGGGNDQPYFEIGSLKTKNISYRTYFLFHLVKEKPKIIELRIEPTD